MEAVIGLLDLAERELLGLVADQPGLDQCDHLTQVADAAALEAEQLPVLGQVAPDILVERSATSTDQSEGAGAAHGRQAKLQALVVANKDQHNNDPNPTGSLLDRGGGV